MAQYFNGILYVEPGADVVVDFDATPKVSNLDTSTVLLLGDAENGLDYSDKKIYAFTSLTDAKSVLKAGKALQLMSCLFNPSPDVRGASKVLFVRTNKGTQAEFKFATGLTLKSARYSVVLTEGATPQGRVGITLSIAGKYPVIVYEDIVGSLEDAMTQLEKDVNAIEGVTAELEGTVLTITSNYNGVDFTLTDPIQPAGTTVEVATVTAFNPTYTEGISIKTKDKGRNIVHYFKLSGGIASFYSDNGIIKMLDGIVTAASLKAAVEADSVLSKLFVVEVTEAAATTALSDVEEVVPFTVAENIATTVASFSEALDRTASRDKSFVMAAFEGQAYQQLLKNYVTSGSDYGCIAFVGDNLGETPTEVMQNAATLNNQKVVLCYPGIYLNLDGESKLYSPLYFAAVCCGLAAGLEPQTPLTRKIVNVLGFEDIDFEGNSEKAVREELINRGVLFGRYSEDLGYFINKGVNTIQGQNNRQILEIDNKSHEISIVRIAIQMQKEIKVAADKAFPGTTRLKPSKTDVESFYAKYMNSKVGTFLTGWDQKSLYVWLEEDAWKASVTGYVNTPINFSFTLLSLAIEQ